MYDLVRVCEKLVLAGYADGWYCRGEEFWIKKGKFHYKVNPSGYEKHEIEQRMVLRNYSKLKVKKKGENGGS